MLITGLILTLPTAGPLPAESLAALRAHPAVTLGERRGMYWPVAVEAEGSRTAEQIQDWLAALPGVAQVDVVSVQFDTGDDAPAGRTATVPVCN